MKLFQILLLFLVTFIMIQLNFVIDFIFQTRNNNSLQSSVEHKTKLL